MADVVAEVACPHAGDPSPPWLGKAWCDTGLEGQRYLAQRAARGGNR